MFGISYGQLLLILGGAAAFIGPKDLPIIGRTLGRLAGRAIGYVQLARGQFESVMQQSQARQVHKELQDTMAQLEAIRHEIRTISFMNPGSLNTRLVDNVADLPHDANVKRQSPAPLQETGVAKPETSVTQDLNTGTLSAMYSEATRYSRLAESTPPFSSNSMEEVLRELKYDSSQFIVLPVSAESAKMLPNRNGELRGCDVLLEAVIEEEVAHSAKKFMETQPPPV
ncbi:hypothetical protein M569_06888 [Genlisea aurea]|uniref:Sec-independent protein translocase protein TatB n=1 Tax=Genlisea aurea TaxID=192259 RepID=S8CSN1_9LAMI|nr:hypothetical protein M569_06888 [Genlisea aurea]